MSAVHDFITKCRRKLVDTSFRNRLLAYKPGARGGGVEIVGEHPGALWDILVARRRPMLFQGTDAGPAAPAEDNYAGEAAPTTLFSEAASATLFSERAPEGPRDAFSVAIESATDARHTDNILETRLETSVLSTRLRRLSDTARLTQQEQGVDTLFLALGFLRFFDEENSDIERLAPLLLVPAALDRDGPDRWKVRARDDDPIINPALVEYLRDQQSLALPPFPDPIETFVPLPWFREVQRLVAAKPRWAVTADCTLGIFSFQKFVMHEDLKRNEDVLASNEVVGQLATRSGGGGGGTLQLPDDVALLDLDDAFAPEKTPQVVNADSTQLRALAAVERGHNLVIEGPPGTGKSQTITNLIAGALAAGRTVLFVAEKQAALNVVFDRLKKVGLGTFCFELHSSKASKAAVIDELRRTLDATLEAGEASRFDGERLAAARDELTSYARAVHRPVQPLGRSVYIAVGRLSALEGAPLARVPLHVEAVSAAWLDGAIDFLGRLASAAARVGEPAQHPWRDIGKTSLDLDAREAAGEALAQLARLLPDLGRAVEAASGPFGLPAGPSLPRACALGDAALVIEASPGVEPAVAGNAGWGTPPPVAADLVRRGRALVAAEGRARACLGAAAADPGLLSAAGTVEQRQGKWTRWVSPAWWSARKLLKGAILSAAWKGAEAGAAEVSAADGARTERESLRADPAGPLWFGARWRGGESDWDALDAVSSWLVKFRGAVDGNRLAPCVATVVEATHPSAEPLRLVASLATEALTNWRRLLAAGGWPAGYWEDSPLADLAARVGALAAAPTAWRDWVEFKALYAEASAGVAGPVVAEAEAGRLAWRDLPLAFERRFYERWLDAQVEGSESLRRFKGATHEERIAAFRRLDQEVLEHHRRVLVSQLRRQAQERLRDEAIAPDLRFLRDQLGRQRGHKPVRELLQKACGAVRAVKPCFLMSPMTVAQCLDPVKHRFDLVVFDEASQVTPEDAVGALARGDQVVVVGDPKQLPPTSFFAVQSGQTEPEPAGDGLMSFSDLDSILELVLAAGFAGAPLRWHYRSRHESLIAFSNQNFYDLRLFTFPSADRDCSVRGLQFHFLSDGLYEGAGVNRAEARHVADAVVAHSRERGGKSLCVGTFSLPQQLAVQDELERRRREDPQLNEFLSLKRDEPFFVKNLESIQGDERDVVILSITYGKGADGKISHNFGPINGQNGWRRLNVLTTRARERMLVFSSMRADDIDLARAQSAGSRFLKEFLSYAETGELRPGPVVDATAKAESPLEEEVIAALVRAGVQVQPQVGVAGYRIDIGVVDPDVPGRFVCGIECDGVAYHAAESARDRDRLREEVLRGLGWQIHRVWSIDWWHDRAGQTKRLVRLIEESKESARRGPPPDGSGSSVEAPSPPEGGGAPAAAMPYPTDEAAPGPGSDPQPVKFAEYVVARPKWPGVDILLASARTVADLLLEILRSEGPLYEKDLRDRAREAFGKSRAGSNIADQLSLGMEELRTRSEVESDGASWRLAMRATRPRTRAGTGIPPERIPSWEYEAAVVDVLSERGTQPEDALVAGVRDGFRYGAASTPLRAGVEGAIERLTKAGRIGIGARGIGLIGGHGSAASE